MKVLYIEGAGCVHAHGNSDVENCRIRTAFTNNDGQKIYLEMISNEINKYNEKVYSEKGYKLGDCIGWIDFLHYITNDPKIDDCNESRLPFERHYSFLFTKENILKFINEKLNCSFDKIQILNKLTGYYVHTGKHTDDFSQYNYGDEFPYDDEKTQKRLAKKAELKAYFEQFMKYDNTSYWVADNGNLMVRINTYEKDFQKMKFKERQFEVEI